MKERNLLKMAGLYCILALSVSCTDELNKTDQQESENLLEVKTHSTIPDEYEEGWLRVKFKHLSDERIDGNTTRTAFTNGITPEALSIKEVADLAKELGATEVRRVFSEGGKYKERRRAAGLHLWYDFFVGTEQPVEPIVRSRTAQPNYVELIELIPVTRQSSTDVSRAATTTFNDPLLKRQWHYQNDGTSSSNAKKGADINLFAAWEITTGHPSVIVAVMDGGVAYAHPELASNMWINKAEKNGTENVDDDDNGYVDDVYGYRWGSANTPPGGGDIKPMDHGSHCAGTIAAVNNNAVGVAGVAGGNGSPNSGVRIMSCQTYVPDPGAPEDPHGKSKSTSQTPDAFAYAADNGAVIINCSFTYGSTTLSAAYKAGIDYFVDNAGKYTGSPMKGGLVVGAAGNDGEEVAKYPASYERCLSVAYMTSDYKKSSSSNYGSAINITAPGGATSSSYAPNKVGGVFSTIPMESKNYNVEAGYSYKSGTSMAAPHVAGVAALIVSAMVEKGVTDFTVGQLWDILLKGTRNIYEYNPEYAGKLGVGYCDARLALDFALGKAVAPGVEALSSEAEINSIDLRWKVPAGFQGNAPVKFILLYSDASIEGADYDNPGQNISRVVVENNKSVGIETTYQLENLEANTSYNIGIVAVYKDDLYSAPCLTTAKTEQKKEEEKDKDKEKDKGTGDNTFTLTPAVVTDYLHIQSVTTTSKSFTIKVFNAIGNKVMERNRVTFTDQEPVGINLAKLASGVYTVVISTDGTEYKYNIIKK